MSPRQHSLIWLAAHNEEHSVRPTQSFPYLFEVYVALVLKGFMSKWKVMYVLLAPLGDMHRCCLITVKVAGCYHIAITWHPLDTSHPQDHTIKQNALVEGNQ